MIDSYSTFLDQLYFILKKNKILLLILFIIYIAFGYYFDRNIRTQSTDIHEYEFEIIKQYPDKYFKSEQIYDQVQIQYSERKFEIIKEIIERFKLDYSNDNNFLTVQSYFMNKDFLYNALRQININQYSNYKEEDLKKLEAFKEEVKITAVDIKNGIKIRLKSNLKINKQLLKEIVTKEYVEKIQTIMDVNFKQKMNTLVSLLNDNISKERNFITEYKNNIRNNKNIVDYNNLENCAQIPQICLYFLKYELEFESFSIASNRAIINLENSLNLLSDLSPVKSFIFQPQISISIYRQFRIPYLFVIPFILTILSIVTLTLREFYLSNNKRKN